MSIAVCVLYVHRTRSVCVCEALPRMSFKCSNYKDCNLAYSSHITFYSSINTVSHILQLGVQTYE